MVEAENRSARILSRALDGAVVVRAASATDRAGRELTVRRRDGREIVMEIRWAGEGWPDDIRRVAADVPSPWPERVVLLARHLSPGAIEWLRERDANWADGAGQVRIFGPDGLLVIREPAAHRREGSSRTGVSWSASALSLAEWILARPDEPLVAARLARACRWSTPQMANVLQSFDAAGWTVKRGPARGPRAHRVLMNADGMLAAWSVAVVEHRGEARVAHRATRDVMALLRDELAAALDRNVRWAASGWAALELAAPFATATPSMHIYVADEDFAGPLSRAMEEGGLREVEEGGRVNFWRADGRIVDLADERGGLPVADAPRLYADLASFEARGQDAADHVKRELIDPLHQASHTSVVEEAR